MRTPTMNWTKFAEALAPLNPCGVFFGPDGGIYTVLVRRVATGRALRASSEQQRIAGRRGPSQTRSAAPPA